MIPLKLGQCMQYTVTKSRTDTSVRCEVITLKRGIIASEIVSRSDQHAKYTLLRVRVPN